MLKKVDTEPERKTSGTCDRSGCYNKGEWLPVLLLYPSRLLYPHADPATAIISLPTCSACKEVVRVDDFLTGAGWEKVVAKFRELKKAEPVRAHTRLTWKRIRATNESIMGGRSRES